jgi:hypothetical protein
MSNIDWTKIDWADLYPRLLVVAAARLNRLGWRGKFLGPVPGAKTPKDFVHDAIVKTMAGERIWRRDNSLFDHFVGVICSEISHLVRSAENIRTLQADEKIIVIADRQDSPETVAARKIQEQKFFDYLETKKPALRELAQFMLYEPGGAPELAAKLNLSDRELDSLKRALRRATEEFVEAEEALDAQPREMSNGS